MNQAQRAIARVQREQWERSLWHQIAHYLRIPGLQWRQQYGFTAVAPWRADAAELTHKLLIEVQGGIWTGGAHTRGAGYERDCIRLAEAQIAGWDVLYVTPGMLEDGRALRLIERWFLRDR